MKISMEFHVHEKIMEFHGKFCGNQWNSMEFFMVFPWNSMEFHETEVDGIPWNSVNSLNFMEFGFDRD
jgi:hypothetical protein